MIKNKLNNHVQRLRMYVVVFLYASCYTCTMRKAFLFVLVMIFLPLTFFSISSYSTQTATANEKVAYQLPYPGILPDHPLYILKVARDRLQDVTTRDPIQKAKLYLLLSDKRAAMAIALVQKGKIKPAISTLSKGEKYFLQIPQLIKTAKQQGGEAPDGLILQLKLSSQKHQEIIDNLLRELPQGELDSLQEIKNINTQIQKDLKSL